MKKLLLYALPIVWATLTCQSYAMEEKESPENKLNYAKSQIEEAIEWENYDQALAIILDLELNGNLTDQQRQEIARWKRIIEGIQNGQEQQNTLHPLDQSSSREEKEEEQSQEEPSLPRLTFSSGSQTYSLPDNERMNCIQAYLNGSNKTYFTSNPIFDGSEPILSFEGDTRFEQWCEKEKEYFDYFQNLFIPEEGYSKDDIQKAVRACLVDFGKMCETIQEKLAMSARFTHTPLDQSVLGGMKGKPLQQYRARNETTIKNVVNIQELFDLNSIHQKWTGNGIKVGFIESGIDKTNPELQNNLAESIIDKPNRKFHDPEHGTGTASTLIKVAPDAKVTVLPNYMHALMRAAHIPNLSNQDFNSFGISGLNNDLQEALKKDKGINILNMSVALPTFCNCPIQGHLCQKCPIDNTIKARIQEVGKAGKLIVLSAGNDGYETSAQSRPRSALQLAKSMNGRMILVGSLAYNQDGREELDSYSIQALSHQDPFICAPGTDILTAKVSGGHDVVSGTSFAAPIVSGALAVLMEAIPEWRQKPENYVNLILLTARKRSLDGRVLGPEYGAGILDLRRALEKGRMLADWNREPQRLPKPAVNAPANRPAGNQAALKKPCPAFAQQNFSNLWTSAGYSSRTFMDTFIRLGKNETIMPEAPSSEVLGKVILAEDNYPTCRYILMKQQANGQYVSQLINTYALGRMVSSQDLRKEIEKLRREGKNVG